ncbi:PREDICTED: uncharacterized protein LOC109581875 isoform X2 [Amphimedon queenslandica]|uniref:Uncharacterized protein n=1 Tax=Amphimedon queenslandica TaxID=400682 RepID=A0A1X7UXA1_AMPQE|nr:PREDICTED: uncharacterized protein LOC109581875 isoform X2 [Amphimedon queenslandica]|eukprot:XP_019851906.1 PREDICTED: uncharacterized protein LOC109581875 isoform X2 [Amphimedon queenslandica]
MPSSWWEYLTFWPRYFYRPWWQYLSFWPRYFFRAWRPTAVTEFSSAYQYDGGEKGLNVTKEENMINHNNAQNVEQLTSENDTQIKSNSPVGLIEPVQKITIDQEDFGAEGVAECFQEWFNVIETQDIEQQLMFCQLFQTTFDLCRTLFIGKIKEPFFALTELTDDENESSTINIKRKKHLENVSKAHKLLLMHSFNELQNADLFQVVKKVKGSLSDKQCKCLVTQEEDLTVEAVKICWKMQMLPTPMFVCQPKVFKDQWHETHYDSWGDDSTNDLVYYRPVLMNSAGGSIAYKGLVGSKSKLSDGILNNHDEDDDDFADNCQKLMEILPVISSSKQIPMHFKAQVDELLKAAKKIQY